MSKRFTMHMLLVALACLSACAEEADPMETPLAAPLGVSALELRAQDDNLQVVYSRDPKRHGPRVVELFIRHSGNLELIAAEPGDAAISAGKEVVAQAKDARTLRVVLFSSSNVLELGSGTLATLKLRRTDQASATAEILLDRPLFAPSAAQDGLTVSDPIEL